MLRPRPKCYHCACRSGSPQRSQSTREEARRRASLVVPSMLEVQLQSQLDLTRVVRSIAGRSDLAKGRVRVVPRSADRHHSVSTKIRLVEVRMVENVKHLRPELELEALT